MVDRYRILGKWLKSNNNSTHREIINCLFYNDRSCPCGRTASAYSGTVLQNLTFWLHYYLFKDYILELRYATLT